MLHTESKTKLATEPNILTATCTTDATDAPTAVSPGTTVASSSSVGATTSISPNPPYAVPEAKKGGGLRERVMGRGKKVVEEEDDDDDDSDIEKDLPTDPIKRREILALRIRSLNIQKAARRESDEKEEWEARKREEGNDE